MTWYAIQYKAAQGDRALCHLQNQDVSCFFPKISVEKIRAGKRIRQLEPLFPGYLFVNLEQTDPMWAKLRSTRGVSRIVSFANRPAPIEDEVICHIRDGFTCVETQGGIRPGQKVEICEGPFAGLDAVFQCYKGDERAIVLLSFMQTQRQVKVPVSAIR